MTVHERSRYTFCDGRVDADGRSFLEDRVPYRFVAHEDNIHHVVVAGDTLWSIAGRYFRPLERSAGFWWAVADFQPNPIHDPTIALVPGSVVVVPSIRTLLEEVLGEKRRGASPL